MENEINSCIQYFQLTDLFSSESGTIITVISLVFAIWQYYRSRKIKAFFESQAMDLHQNIANALGAIQGAKENRLNHDALTLEIGRAEGICQALLNNSASNLLNVSNLSSNQIEDRIREERLSPDYRSIYLRLSRNKQTRILRWWMKRWF